MEFSVREVNEGRDVTPQIQQRVPLNGGFGLAKPGPWKECQAPVDG